MAICKHCGLSIREYHDKSITYKWVHTAGVAVGYIFCPLDNQHSKYAQPYSKQETLAKFKQLHERAIRQNTTS